MRLSTGLSLFVCGTNVTSSEEDVGKVLQVRPTFIVQKNMSVVENTRSTLRVTQNTDAGEALQGQREGEKER